MKVRGEGRVRQRSKASASERLTWARAKWEENITIPVTSRVGDESMMDLLYKQFGVTSSVEQLHDVRRGVKKSNKGRKRAKEAKRKAEAEAKRKATQPKEKRAVVSSPPSAPKATADAPGQATFPSNGMNVVPEPEAEVVDIKDAKKRRKGKGGRTPTGRRKLPKGSKSKEQIEARKTWARLQLALRPHMPLQGPDGLATLLRDRFGVGLSYNALKAIKDDVINEHEDAETLEAARIGAEVRAMEQSTKVAEANADIESAVQAGAQIIMDAIPNLHSFSLSVDDDGVASVDWSVRKVIEAGGTVKVK